MKTLHDVKVGDRITVQIASWRQDTIVSIEAVTEVSAAQFRTASGAWSKRTGKALRAEGARSVHQARPWRDGDDDTLAHQILLEGAAAILRLRNEDLAKLPDGMLVRIRAVANEAHVMLDTMRDVAKQQAKGGAQ